MRVRGRESLRTKSRKEMGKGLSILENVKTRKGERRGQVRKGTQWAPNYNFLYLFKTLLSRKFGSQRYF